MKCGIDFSLTSPSICIELENKYRFISFFDRGNDNWKKLKKYQNHREIDGKIDLYSFSKYVDKSDYRKEQITKMKCANDLSHYIVETIIREITRSKEPVLSVSNPIIIGLEGFSYNSVSSSYIDLIMYQSFLRSILINEFPFIKFHIIPPTEAKKVLSGKGNANKEEMIRSFIDNKLNDDKLINCKFWKYLKEKELDWKNIKPLDDLVDAYAVLKSI